MHIRDYPNVLKALGYVGGDNGISVLGDNREVPPEWEQRFKDAEVAAAELDDRPVEAFIDCDDEEDSIGGEDALEYIAMGEDIARLRIVGAVHGGSALEQVLEAAFEGELHELVFGI